MFSQVSCVMTITICHILFPVILTHDLIFNFIKMFPNYKMPWRVFFCLLIVVAAPTSATTDDISSLRNFICVLIRFWSWQGNLSNKERRKIKENTKKQNVSRLAENVTRFEKTKTCFRHYEKRVTMATQERDLSLLKDTSKRLLCSITTERDF